MVCDKSDKIYHQYLFLNKEILHQQTIGHCRQMRMRQRSKKQVEAMVISLEYVCLDRYMCVDIQVESLFILGHESLRFIGPLGKHEDEAEIKEISKAVVISLEYICLKRYKGVDSQEEPCLMLATRR